jgi:N-acyl-D-aspartate/D-glutamate deacylase
MLDLVITGATVIDGTGAPGRQADIGVRDGRIVAFGDVTEGATRCLDASDLVVAPGVVDLHTHYDAQLSWDPTASPSCYHGVTTVIGGNCGFTLAPAGPDNADYLMRLMARVEGMPLDALQHGLSWDWTSFGDWLGRLDGRTAVNAGFLCGHSALRRSAMGADATGSEANPEQVAAMADLLDEAMAAGALGLSSSQAHTHHDGDGQPVPSRWATREELLDLARAVSRRPGTTLELILAGCINGFSDDEVTLMTDLSVAADRPLNWNVLGVGGGDGWRRQLDASTRAASNGGTVVALTLPHPMRLWLSFNTGFVLDALPGWAEILHLPAAERLRALADPAIRKRMGDAAASPEAGVLGNVARWEQMTIAESPSDPSAVGRTVRDVAAERDQSAWDTVVDIVVADELRTGLTPPAFGDDDETWNTRAEAWRDPRTVIGGSDAGAHLDLMCGAVYSTTVLGPAVRDRALLSLEEAVHQLTDVPARLYGLRQRGRVAEGWFADLVVFDPDTVGPGPVHTRDDLPGGAARLYAEATGVHHVIVNGTEIATDGRATGETPGTVIRSGRDTDTVHAGASS